MQVNGIGAVLKQIQDNGKQHPIGYFSKKLKDYQRNYCITELECLAIVEAMDYWHHYIYGKKLTIITDHQALKWLRSFKKPNSRLFNWSLRLSQYEFDIKYVPGVTNVEADLLSRNPVLEDNKNTDHIKIVNLLERKEIISLQEKELDKNLQKHNDIIVRTKRDQMKIVVPKSLQLKLLEKCHLNFGHIGKKKMLYLICGNYTWPNMSKDVSIFVDKCAVCQLNKINRSKKYGSYLNL